ncbi:peptidoglycan bridge formation glycyltransferase FemA/FemB family protein [Candidatus Saccharibacteria bacterium]|nr:peptidoglycan bridge formation glycyltransferase FemA/FemB family protein [Candidatus Saccharibacteria bacterium]
MEEKHFLQSEQWERFNKHLGKQVFTDSGQGWSYLAILEFTPLGRYLYLPYGPYISGKNGFEGAFNSLHKLARAKRVMFTRIEPTGLISTDTLHQYGFHKSRQVNPEHTWVLDLSASENDVLAGMQQTNRNLYHNYHKKGLSVHHTTDASKIHYLTDLLGVVAKHNSIHVHTEDYLWAQVDSGAATLYYVTLDKPEAGTSQPVIAAALVYDSPTTRYYAHAAADYEHRKLAASTILLARMIIDAKVKGLKWFDFYGITDSGDPAHPWHGFTKFKKSFGGQAKSYLGTWEKPRKRGWYAAFKVLSGLKRRLRLH